jgi:hypothetical protein
MAEHPFKSERILPDDYPVYGMYAYVVDGRPYQSDFHDITVGELRRRLKATEVRNYSFGEREASPSKAEG